MGSYELIPEMKALLESAKLFLNSNFFTALIGAFAGAYGGQLIVEKTKERESNLTELHSLNSAITFSFGICRSMLSLKEQHVKRLYEEYIAQKGIVETHISRTTHTDTPTIIKFKADLETIELREQPIEVLQKTVYEKIAASAKIISFASLLGEAITSLNESINKRNLLINEYRGFQPLQPESFVNLYFGLPDDAGNIDTSYPTFIDSIYRETDDCIMFSSMLCSELIARGKFIKEKIGEKSLVVYVPDFTKAKTDGLWPDESAYASWHNAFPSKNNN